MPSKLLHAMWLFDGRLAGYQQQDAHELYVALLDGLHLACDGSSQNCSCFIHHIFAGQLRSDVSCTVCHSTFTALDPMMDVSLDMKRAAPPVMSTEPIDLTLDESASAATLGKPKKAIPASFASSLAECLDRYARANRWVPWAPALMPPRPVCFWVCACQVHPHRGAPYRRQVLLCDVPDEPSVHQENIHSIVAAHRVFSPQTV